MKQLVFSAGNDWTGLTLRIFIAFAMLPHGSQKLLGWFGGYGYKATMDYFTGSMKLPWIVSLLVIVIEFFGPISLIVGFASKIWAFAFIILMVGAIQTTNLKNGFFMNWFGNQQGEGYEYHLLIIGISIAIMLNGSGKFSLDQLIGN